MPMITRNKGKHQAGYYQILNTNYTKNKISKTDQNSLKSYSSFVKKINIRILKSLKYIPKKSILSSFKFEISISLYNKLKKQFKLNGRYLCNVDFSNFFKLKNKRYFNSTDYCTYDPEQFKVKLTKHKKFSYFDKELKAQYLEQEAVFSFKFIRLDEKENRF